MMDDPLGAEAPAQATGRARGDAGPVVARKGRIRVAIRRFSRPEVGGGAGEADAGDAGAMPGDAAGVSADVRRIRAQLADATAAARRAMERVRLARLVVAIVAQVVLALVVWRITVWRAQRRRR
jgi:hypothetical protein